MKLTKEILLWKIKVWESTLRKEKSMTQSELAERMNVTDKAVSKWERNISCPDINSSTVSTNIRYNNRRIIKCPNQESHY